jgi:hypothetical protein
MKCLLRACPVLAMSLLLAVASPAWAQTGCPCVEPDVSGTIIYPPQTCITAGYLGTMQIADGLAAGTTIDCDVRLGGFHTVGLAAGGTLGGETQVWSAYLYLQVTGTGNLAGFARIIQVPVTGITHSAPRTYGDAVQSFDHNLMSLSGELFGDPDLCVLRITAGPLQSLPPSLGHTTLTRVGPPGSDFEVDSFFDITYRIEYQGCPGRILDGMSGADENSDSFIFCAGPVPVEETTWGRVKVLYN